MSEQITAKQLAERLNGREYGDEISREEELHANDWGLIVIFGASDDLTEIRGCIHDELGTYDGGEIFLHKGGILTDPSGGDCEHCCERTNELAKKCALVTAKWDAEKPYSWTFATDVPHYIFDVMEDGEKYCRGIVLDRSDLPSL